MPEFRQDPIVGRWVSVATERSQRPSDFPHRSRNPTPAYCPFCSGQGALTPHAELGYRACQTGRNTLGWMVRLVANKSPVCVWKVLGEGCQGDV